MNRSEVLRCQRFFEPKGKEARIARREERIAHELASYEAEKASRIACRVIAALSGADVSTNWEILSKEIMYLKRRSISFTPLRCEPKL